MSDRSTIAIARIPLARRPLRLLAAPLVLLLAGIAAAVGGLLVGGAAGIGLVAGGIVVAVLSAYLAIIPFSARLDVEVATLRLRWLGGQRSFTLVRGAVTRVPLAGEGAARLRPRFGALGWALGPARLRDEETIQVVRLAPTPTIILVPTDQGRFGIAPASESQLIEALTAAARVQQRLDEVATRARAFLPPTPVPLAPEPPEPEAPAPEAPPEEERPRVMTGIERALLERRLAEERAAALAAAEAERRAAEQAALAAPAQETSPPTEDVAAPRPRRRLRAPSLPRPRVALGPARLAAYAVVALPAVAAGGLWGWASLQGRLDLPLTELRALALALVLAGPAGSVAALVARAWFPRLLGPVAVSALAALILIGRSLIG